MPTLKMRFRSPEGHMLVGWKPVYLSDDLYYDHDKWVDQLLKEGEVERLTKHITINVPSRESCADTRYQMVYIGEEIMSSHITRNEGSWRIHPMSRSACDGHGTPCPYQDVCYSENPETVNIDSLGLYANRNDSTVAALSKT